MVWWCYAVTAVSAYLLGSIPSGFLAASAHGIDIREVGSGNIGATNVSRALGRGAGIAVLLADCFKGWFAVEFLPRLVFVLLGVPAEAQTRELSQILAGLCVVLGHNYTVWLKFKGGKGIATSGGVLVALVPWALLIILGIWIVVFLISRYVSLASIAASFALPFATWLTDRRPLFVIVTAVMGALAIFKHHANIGRLLNGTESRFGKRKDEVSKEGL